MKLVAPVSKLYEVEAIIRAGADQIYCGVYTQEWRRKYTDVAAPNRHPSKFANLGEFKELRRIVMLAHSCSIPVFFTLNEFYSGRQYGLALTDAERAIEAGVDALIVVDINLLLMIKERGHNIKIHMGTGATTFNSETAAFYRNLGASRLILDRQLTIEEIGAIALKSPDVELEAFVLNQKCHNIDGFCSFQHGLMGARHPLLSRLWDTRLLRKLLNSLPYSAQIQSAILQRDLGCCLKYEIFNIEKSNAFKKKDNFLPSTAEYFLDTCGVCALYDLNRIKIKFVKIVGRENFPYKKSKDVNFIRKCIDLLNNNPDKKTFINEVKSLRKEIYSSNCDSKLCYYPDNILSGEA